MISRHQASTRRLSGGQPLEVMTTVCGVLRFDGAPVDRGELERMTAAPYGVGAGRTEREVWTDGQVGLALGLGPGDPAAPRPRRLQVAPGPLAALVAEADGTEPGQGVSGRFGDRAAPAAGTLAAYRRWGKDYPARLPEPWAAALWDGVSRQLLLVRDRVGERPLYWSRTPEALRFATEPVQLLAAGAESGRPHRLRMLAYLLSANGDPEWSYFEGIQRLPEGCWLCAGEDGKVEVRRYWDWRSVPELDRGPEEAADDLLERLDRAVSRRLATGETGVLLSGGLDSCSVAALAADRLARRGRSLHALTWTSATGDALDETGVSRLLVASRPNILEHAVPADRAWPLSRYPEVFCDPNDPETSAYPDLLLSTLETARRTGCGTVLNGLGGDLVVGGLVPDLAILLRGRFPTLARRLRSGGWKRSPLLYKLRGAGANRVPEWLTVPARRLAAEAGLQPPSISWRALASPAAWRLQAIASPANAVALERFERLGRLTGVRIAAPWHDAEIATLVLGLPDRALAPLEPQKQLLRAAMKSHLPEPVLRRATEKGASAVLLRRGLLNHARSTIELVLSHSALAELGLIEPAAAVACYRRHLEAGRIMPGLWSLVSLEGWLGLRGVSSASPPGRFAAAAEVSA